MIEGKTEIPAFCKVHISKITHSKTVERQTLMAMTKGLLAAVEARSREGSEGETSNPICRFCVN